MKLTVKRDGKPEALTRSAGDTRYGFFLVGPDDVRHGGYLGEVVRVSKDAASVTTVKGKYSLRFFGAPEVAGARSLEYVFPDKVKARELTFRIENVPLP